MQVLTGRVMYSGTEGKSGGYTTQVKEERDTPSVVSFSQV